MHPDDPVGAGARNRQVHDRDRRRVGRQHHLRSRPGAERPKDLQLRVDVLGGCLDHEVRLCERFEVGRPPDPSEQRDRVVVPKLPALDGPADRALDGSSSSRDEVVRFLDEDDLRTGPSHDLNDARAHDATSHDADLPNIPRLHGLFALPALSARKPTIDAMWAPGP